jgi:hypothetical protein
MSKTTCTRTVARNQHSTSPPLGEVHGPFRSDRSCVMLKESLPQRLQNVERCSLLLPGKGSAVGHLHRVQARPFVGEKPALVLRPAHLTYR